MAETLDPKLIGSLLALLAHDLRNPLSALQSNLGYLEALGVERESDAREALSDVTASCGSMKHIIDNLELLGMLTQGYARTLERAPVALLEMVTETIGRFQTIAQSYGVKVVVAGESRRDLRVKAHREMLSRAFGNILFNSIQHGGSSAPVSVTISSDDKSGWITCSDYGSPLAVGLLAEAFTAEGQLLTKNDALGRYSRGLGLFAARIAAELAGASVRALEPTHGANRFELRAALIG